jgi:hypothetical protein
MSSYQKDKEQRIIRLDDGWQVNPCECYRRLQ